MREILVSRPGSQLAAVALTLVLAACSGGGSGSSTSGGPPPIDPNDPADVLYAQGLAAYNAANQAVTDARAVDSALASSAAQSLVATGEADYVAAQGFFDQLTRTYPTSIRYDYAAYYAARSSYEIGTIDPASVPTSYLDARDRLELLGQQRPLSSLASQTSYFQGRARFHLAALKPPVGPLDTYAAARVDFQRSLAVDPSGMFADNAQYYVGRTWFEEGFPLANSLVANPDPAVATSAQMNFQNAERELDKVPTLYPSSSYVDNARYYWGVSKILEPELISTVRVTNLQDAIAKLALVVATAGWATPSVLIPGAHYWSGKAHYDLAFHLASGGQKDQPHIQSAIAEFKQVSPPSVYADNALYWLAKSYVWFDPDGAGAATAPFCTGGPAGSPPGDACAACNSLSELVNAPGSKYAGSPYPSNCSSYITDAGCTCPP